MKPPHALRQQLQQASPQISATNMDQFVREQRFEIRERSVIDQARREQDRRTKQTDHGRAKLAAVDLHSHSPAQAEPRGNRSQSLLKFVVRAENTALKASHAEQHP